MVLSIYICATIISNILCSEAVEIWLNNVPCAPYPIPIETDPELHNLYPSTVMLQRCHGNYGGSLLHCESKENTAFDLTVYNLLESGPTTIPLFNHTKCQLVCSIGPEQCNQYEVWNGNSCKCDCPSQKGDQCTELQYWDRKSCKCKCMVSPSYCGLLKEWDESTCQCKCKETKELMCCRGSIDSFSCKCIESGLKGGF